MKCGTTNPEAGQARRLGRKDAFDFSPTTVTAVLLLVVSDRYKLIMQGLRSDKLGNKCMYRSTKAEKSQTAEKRWKTKTEIEINKCMRKAKPKYEDRKVHARNKSGPSRSIELVKTGSHSFTETTPFEVD